MRSLLGLFDSFFAMKEVKRTETHTVLVTFALKRHNLITYV